MNLRRITFATLSALFLVTCTSCNLSDFDQNGDGTVTRDEILSTLADFVCGTDQTETPTDNGTTTDGSTPSDSPTDEPPTTDGTTGN